MITSLLDKEYYSSHELPEPVEFEDLAVDEVRLPLEWSDYRIGDMIVLGSESYTVKSFGYDYGYFIHPDRFRDLVRFNRFTFQTISQVNETERQNLMNELNQKYSIESAMTPQDAIQFYNNESPLIFTVLITFFAVSMFSMAYILAYIVKNQARNNWVMRLTGLSQKQLVSHVVVELLLFILFSTVVAFTLHQIFWKPFFQKITPRGVRELLPQDYFLILLFALVISLVILLPRVILESRKTLKRLEVDL